MPKQILKTIILLTFFFGIFNLLHIHAINIAQAYDCANPDPAWIFCDDFERDADFINGEVSIKGWEYTFGSGSHYWPTCSNSAACVEISNSEAHSGSRSLQAWYPAGDTGANAHANQTFNLIMG
jgi:hypothetical protein